MRESEKDLLNAAIFFAKKYVTNIVISPATDKRFIRLLRETHHL